MRRFLPLFVLLLGLLQPRSVSAQVQCGVVHSLDFPVDPTRFRVMQDYGAQSYRHQGRYHTGEDWYGGDGVGEYVRAIAAGRVTFSSANGWGRDGGVIIIEHTFPDSSVAYSMYGHITDQTGVQFPAVYSCVQQGDVLAAVGDARPTPHVHLEIRTTNPDIPGAGYTWNYPADEGLRRPSKFILNWQTWLTDAYRWRLDLADETGAVAPPVPLADNGLLALDSNRVIRVSADGRLLWRVNLSTVAVGLLPASGDGAYIAYADGHFERVNNDSTVGETWELGIALAGAPLILADRILFPTPNGIAALDSAARSVLWAQTDLGAVARWQVAGDQIGVITTANAMITLTTAGTILDEARLREPGALAADSGGLLAYTRGGAWRIDAAGAWTPLIENTPAGGAESAVASDGRVFLWDGASLYGYNAEHFGLWQLPLPGVDGTAQLEIFDRALLLTTSHGDLIAIQPESGGVCNRTRIYGDNFTQMWHALGADGILRVHLADQIIGLDWEEFLLGCA